MPETIKDQINNVTEKNEAADFETKVSITTKNLEEIEAQKINLAAYETNSKSEQDSPDENDILIVTDYDGKNDWKGTAFEVLMQMRSFAEYTRGEKITDQEYFNSMCSWLHRLSKERINKNEMTGDLKKDTRILFNKLDNVGLIEIEKTL